MSRRSPHDEVLPTWRAAWQQALYGDGGFYHRPEGPRGHFRTACHAAPAQVGAAMVRLARAGGCGAVVDVGAGRGELVAAIASQAPDLQVHGVDVVDRPPGLPDGIGWSRGLERVPAALASGATPVLLMAWELLDNIACDVVEVDAAGLARVVTVDVGSGREVLGGRIRGELDEWCRRWWALDGAEPGSRAEVGVERDRVWAELVSGLPRGLLLAVDYAHTRGTRPRDGSLAGFRGGRMLPPVPDGSCDITAHVALDAVAAAGRASGAGTQVLTTQREALRVLGVRRRTPSVGEDAAALLARLQHDGCVAELMDPGGLGGFGWLLQGRDVEIPLALERLGGGDRSA